MAKEYIAKESTSQEILAKITPQDLTSLRVYIADFLNDEKTITKGGYDSYERKIIST